MKPTPDMTVLAFWERFYIPRRRLSSESVAGQARAIKRLAEAIGREPLVSDLPQIAKHQFRKGAFEYLVAIWRYAADLDLCDIDREQVRKQFNHHYAGYFPDEAAAGAEPSPAMRLIDFVLLHYAKTKHAHIGKLPGPAAITSFGRVCDLLRRRLGRHALISDLSIENVEAVLEDYGRTHAIIGVKTVRGLLLALWRFAADKGLVDLPDDLRRKHRGYELNDAPDTLWGVCVHQFFPLNLRLRSDETKRGYKLALRHFSLFLGRDPTLADLNDDTVTAWTKVMLDAQPPVSAYTVRERLGRILTLWNWAARRRLVEPFPTVRRPEGPEPVPVALSVAELTRLFQSAGRMKGTVAGIPARHWWTAWLAFIYSTGERYGAARQLRWEWVDLERGVVQIPASARKGGKKHATYYLWPEVLALLKLIRQPDRELVFPWDRDQTGYYADYKTLLRRAGLPTGRKYKTHCLRATHATIRTVLGGDASRALLHSDPATTRRHYIDQRHLPPDQTKLPVPWTDQPTPAVPATSAPAIPDEALLWL